MAITKPPVLPVWGENNTTAADMVQPTNPQIQTGWPLSTTPPSRQRFNWFFNYVMNAVRYFCRAGLPDYDAAETYQGSAVIRGDDGLIYRSIQNDNTNHTPSASPTWWDTPAVKTPPPGDNTIRIATTAYVQTAISGKANTTGTYAGMTVGNATNAANAAVAASAGTAPWSGITGKPTTVAGYGITDAITTGNIGVQSVAFATNANSANTATSAGSAGTVPWSGVTGRPNTVAGYGITDGITTGNIGAQSVAFATTAGRARPRRWDDSAIDIIWSGQPGQPNWLLGSNDGFNFYVWNPNNFSVNFATSASQATTQAAGTSNTSIATTQFACPGFSHADYGYDRLPSGLLLQWGTTGGIGGGGGSQFVVFPVAFASACFTVITESTTAGGNAQSESYSDSIGATSFRKVNSGSVTRVYKWFAIGR